MDVKTIYSPRCNEVPLAKITIISFPRIGCTSLGISIAHVIGSFLPGYHARYSPQYLAILPGDGYNSYQFARFLSQYYQGLPPLTVLPSYAPPPPYPRSGKFQDLWIPTIDHPFHKSVVPPFMDPTCEKSIRLAFRLSAGQLGLLQRAVTDSRESTDTRGVLSLSRQDTIGALLARCFTKADSKNAPVEHVSTCFMVRVMPIFDHVESKLMNGFVKLSLKSVEARVRARKLHPQTGSCSLSHSPLKTHRILHYMI